MTRPGRKTPLSTYRLQLRPGFTFADASAVVPYLASLGITDCYCSPIFTARPGSTHGYDVCDHNQINPELGGEAGFLAFAATLRDHSLGLIMDFVPNHMGNDPRTNHWWRDVLENGPSSPFAQVFDIDWNPIKLELRDRLLLPILGEQYGAALESGQLQLAFDVGALVLDYHSHRLPVNPRSAATVFEADLNGLAAALGEDHRDLREYRSIITALRNLPPYIVRDPARVEERQREKEVARDRMATLAAASPAIEQHIESALARFNGTPGQPDSFDPLHELLELQAYRLASWKTASDEINYRRFFDINDLAGLRVEDPQVFDDIHRLLLDLTGRGLVSGLRLDHIDGLADPAAYLERLQAGIRDARRHHGDPAPDGEAFHVVVEKILSLGEQLPPGWETAGTTGYNFLNDVNGIFVDPRHKRRFWSLGVRFTGRSDPLADVVYDSKRLIISTALSSEFQVLVNAINRLSESQRGSRDFTMSSIRRALREVVGCFPVYRTYVSREGVSQSDRSVVDATLAAARARNPALEPSIFEFLRSVLLPEPPAADAPPDAVRLYERRLEVAMKFQQYTSPVQAKGVEDTAFFRFNLLLSLNEVGGEPDRFGRSVSHFHQAARERLARWPAESTATATHDTKRGEDARARLNVISEMPNEWRDAVHRWTRITRPARVLVDRNPAPDGGDEYHFYQSLLAVWPAEPAGAPVPPSAPDGLDQRLGEAMTKAIREAKLHTSWINPNAAYEEAVVRFVNETLHGAVAPAFLAAFVPLARRVARLGAFNALGQLVLKLVSPGVPDFYQGTELWNLTLVDPDNRRAVDYGERSAALAALDPLLAISASGEGLVPPEALHGLLDTWYDGRFKLYVTACGLRARRASRELFLSGDYVALESEGSRESHLIACGRSAGADVVVAAVPRLISELDRGEGPLLLPSDAWMDTRIALPAAWAGRRWRNLLSGALLDPVVVAGTSCLPATQLFADLPVALLRVHA
ncbi:MAG: malto-oligosyltrehalose synthase [Acidobacteria bacterium]|nr:malto-oligosyltrehalose synthase [Acidobacteriota bacterium]